MYLSLRYEFPVTASVRGHGISAAFWNAKREMDNVFGYQCYRYCHIQLIMKEITAQ